MVVWRNIIVFFQTCDRRCRRHSAAGPVPGNAVAFPGIAIVAVNGAWMTVLFGMLSARFRDIPPFVGNLMQI
jgi:hypothetical protein